MTRTRLAALSLLCLTSLAPDTPADEKLEKAREATKKKVLKQLDPKKDGRFLIALEEVKGGKVSAVTVKVSKGPDDAASEIAEFVHGGDKQVRRSFQLIAKLEASEKGEKLAEQHRKKLQGFIDARLRDPVFSRDACYSDLEPSSGKSLNQKMAEGTAVRYLPLR